MLKKSRVHAIRPGRTKTINGMVSAYCKVIDWNTNEATHERHKVTCQNCLKNRGQEELKQKLREKR